MTLEIYNILGQKVKTLEDKFLPAGEYKLSWDGTDDHGSNVGSGSYFYKLHAGKYSQVRKMILTK